MRSIYLAGPMRNYPNFNYPAFDKAKALLESQGWYVISPADMDRTHGQAIDHSGVGKDVSDRPTGYDYEANRVFIRRDVDVLVNRLRPENGDGFAILPGLSQSVGATGEYGLAKWAKLPMYSALTGARLDGPYPPDDVDYEWDQMQPPEFRSCGCGPGGGCAPYRASPEEEAELVIAQRLANTEFV